MKKALWTVAGIIICVGLIVLVISLIFGTNIITAAFNAVGQYINDFWQELSGQSDVTIFSDVTSRARETIDGFGF